jgi:hypothetical protein
MRGALPVIARPAGGRPATRAPFVLGLATSVVLGMVVAASFRLDRLTERFHDEIMATGARQALAAQAADATRAAATDRLKAVTASLELLPQTPAETQRLAQIDAALAADAAAGATMSQSNRTRIDDLVGREVEAAAQDSAAIMVRYERAVVAVLALAAIGLGATVAGAVWLAARGVFRSAPALAGE